MSDRVLLDDKLRKYRKHASAVRADKEPDKFDLKEVGGNNEPRADRGHNRDDAKAGECTIESM